MSPPPASTARRHPTSRRCCTRSSRRCSTSAASGKLTPLLAEGSSERLEGWIDALEQELEPLTQFILPGGAPVAAALHHARTVCRRAERRAVSLATLEEVAGELLVYLNRLSDFLFVAARAVNRREGVEEPRWASPRGAGES